MKPIPTGAEFSPERIALARTLLPTSLGTAGLRDQVAVEVRRMAVFSARVTSRRFLMKAWEVFAALGQGEMDDATGRVILLEMLRALNYTPEGGFPELPGDAPPVPPAMRGTLQDLSSFRRLDLVVKTQRALISGMATKTDGETPDRLQVAPAWELVRRIPVTAPRLWTDGDDGSPAKVQGETMDVARWTLAGGTLYAGRMIALKGDPIWGELGSSGNFDDALDVDHPPFAFNSGMFWREVLRDEAEALGVTGPDGIPMDEFLMGIERPLTLDGELPLPSAKMSVRDIDPELVEELRREPLIVESVPGEPDRVVPAGAGDRAARRAARQERSRARWADAAARKRREEAENP